MQLVYSYANDTAVDNIVQRISRTGVVLFKT